MSKINILIDIACSEVTISVCSYVFQGKGYYEQMVERNAEFFRQNLEFTKATKDALIVGNVFTNKEWKELNKGKKTIDKIQMYVHLIAYVK